MAYQLQAATIRANNSAEGMGQTGELWTAVLAGKLPLLFDSDGSFRAGISPVARYSNYSSDESGDYDLTILAAQAGFFEEMEQKTAAGLYRKYETADEGGDIGACTRQAWELAWKEQAAGTVKRSFTEDFESTVPSEYAPDGKAHCVLYIAVTE